MKRRKLFEGGSGGDIIMTLQVGVVTRDQNDFSLLDKMKIDSDVIIANQCGKTEKKEIQYGSHRAVMVSSDTIGVGKNRNLCILYSDADILLFSDDDITYQDGYADMILEEFSKHPDADVIFFRFRQTKKGEVFFETPQIKGRKRGHFYNVLKYGAISIAVKRSSIMKRGLTFSELFGGGSLYGGGEDSLFIISLLKTGCKLYRSDYLIGSSSHDVSSWFSGYNDKYFFDSGAFVACAFPKAAWIAKWFYILRFAGISEISMRKRRELLDQGIQAFDELRGFEK